MLTAAKEEEQQFTWGGREELEIFFLSNSNFILSSWLFFFNVLENFCLQDLLWLYDLISKLLNLQS